LDAAADSHVAVPGPRPQDRGGCRLRVLALHSKLRFVGGVSDPDFG
jgi:hypothetical protein